MRRFIVHNPVPEQVIVQTNDVVRQLNKPNNNLNKQMCRSLRYTASLARKPSELLTQSYPVHIMQIC